MTTEIRIDSGVRKKDYPTFYDLPVLTWYHPVCIESELCLKTGPFTHYSLSRGTLVEINPTVGHMLLCVPVSIDRVDATTIKKELK